MLKNLVTLVTGGASGLGKATVERFVQKGGRVVFCDLNASEGEKVAKTIGENCIFVKADVTSRSDMETFLKTAKETFGRVDVVLNCAGVSLKTPKDDSVKEFQEIVNTMLLGTYNVLCSTASAFSENELNRNGQRGVFINTAGRTINEDIASQAAYAAASAGVIGMTRAAAAELSDQGVRVVTIAPTVLHSLPENIAKETVRNPADYANLVQSIVANSYLNATTIQVDGVIKV